MNIKNLQDFIKGYMAAIFFAESVTDHDGEEIEHIDNGEFTLNPEALEASKQDCARFMDSCAALLARVTSENDYDYEQAGIDLWFTRNGHGVGYWDRGLGEDGDQLSRIARKWGPRHVYLDDNNQIGVE